jgi:hypothetical protein
MVETRDCLIRFRFSEWTVFATAHRARLAISTKQLLKRIITRRVCEYLHGHFSEAIFDLRVRPETSGRIAEFSEHEAD